MPPITTRFIFRLVSLLIVKVVGGKAENPDPISELFEIKLL